MTNHLSEYSTESLLRMRGQNTGDKRFEIEVCLFERWRDGIDLDYLFAFFQSRSKNVRLTGAFFLGEVTPRVEDMKEPAMYLASDSLAECRRTFVAFVLNSGFYDERIAARLATCMMDFDLHVRIETIHWATQTTDERFEDFSCRVEAAGEHIDAGIWGDAEMKRARRGLDIARRLRSGETIAEIRQSTPGEDSFTFDYFQRFEERMKRRPGRGKLGEEFDGVGKQIRKLPTSPDFADLTDQELNELMERMKESIWQRQYEQRMSLRYLTEDDE